MTGRPTPESAPLVSVACAEPGCLATTLVEAVHAPRLAGRWRCREHYAGAWAGASR